MVIQGGKNVQKLTHFIFAATSNKLSEENELFPLISSHSRNILLRLVIEPSTNLQNYIIIERESLF